MNRLTSLAAVLSISAIMAGTGCTSSQHGPKRHSRDKMMSGEHMQKMHARQAKLDQLVSDMNAAKGTDQKLDAAIAVINEMTAARKAMHAKMKEGCPMCEGKK